MLSVISGLSMRVCGTIALALCLAVVPVQAVDLATPQVLAELPHDTTSFTQGFLFYDGFFYESTGLYGQSTLRRNDPATGVALQQISIHPVPSIYSIRRARAPSQTGPVVRQVSDDERDRLSTGLFRAGTVSTGAGAQESTWMSARPRRLRRGRHGQ